ncbi:AcrB/AcrD/AcrF family protein [Paraburkholderia sp. RAU2J]|nr:AcrB/AcrD/AcrF family protein [Paraburkholderia sp. RAU2J]
MLALILCGKERPIVGMILLIDNVKNNAILVIGFAFAVARLSLSVAARRDPQSMCALSFGPFMMTTLAALISVLPFAPDHGADAELRVQLGILVGGRTDRVAESDVVHDAGGASIVRSSLPFAGDAVWEGSMAERELAVWVPAASPAACQPSKRRKYPAVPEPPPIQRGSPDLQAYNPRRIQTPLVAASLASRRCAC